MRNISLTKELSENELTPHCPQQHQRKSQIYFYYFYYHFFLIFFLILKPSITPLIFTFITYNYFAKKKTLFFKANFIYIFKNNFCDLFFSFL